MNTALEILTHAMRMLIFDISATLRVLMPAVLLVLGASLGIATFAPDIITMLETPPAEAAAPAPTDAFAFILLGIVALLGYALMAILWHRHVLMNGAERPEDLRPSASIFFGYLGRAIVVGIVQLVAAIPVALAMAVLGALLTTGDSTGFAVTLIGLAGSVIFIWIALRFSVALPAAALGQKMSVRDSWTLTHPVSAPLWGLALLLTGLNMCIYLVTAVLVPDQGVIAILAQTIIFIVEGLIFISVLTTLYGHLAEGRSLGR